MGVVARLASARHLSDLPTPPLSLPPVPLPPSPGRHTHRPAAAGGLPPPPAVWADADAAATEAAARTAALERCGALLGALLNLPHGRYLLRKATGSAGWSILVEGQSLLHAASSAASAAAAPSPHLEPGLPARSAPFGSGAQPLGSRHDFDCAAALATAAADGPVTFVRPEWRERSCSMQEAPGGAAAGPEEAWGEALRPWSISPGRAAAGGSQPGEAALAGGVPEYAAAVRRSAARAAVERGRVAAAGARVGRVRARAPAVKKNSMSPLRTTGWVPSALSEGDPPPASLFS
eukprot:scaffold23839_cov100-Isochrysis_galbana.AAC.5